MFTSNCKGGAQYNLGCTGHIFGIFCILHIWSTAAPIGTFISEHGKVLGSAQSNRTLGALRLIAPGMQDTEPTSRICNRFDCTRR